MKHLIFSYYDICLVTRLSEYKIIVNKFPAVLFQLLSTYMSCRVPSYMVFINSVIVGSVVLSPEFCTIPDRVCMLSWLQGIERKDNAKLTQNTPAESQIRSVNLTSIDTICVISSPNAMFDHFLESSP